MSRMRRTALIMRQQAAHAARDVSNESERDSIKLKHQTAQRMLRPIAVRIPFANYLGLPTTKVASRRIFPQFLGMIEAVALLRQFQKQEADGSASV